MRRWTSPGWWASWLSTEKKGARMSTIHLHQTTRLTPEQYVAGLTDFGPGRSRLFGNSADEYLKVHHQGPKEADVTEGSGGIWERLHYDWSDPTTSSSRPPTPTRGEAIRATLTTSRGVPTARPTSTSSWSATARTSRDGFSASCWRPSVKASWRRPSQAASRRSRLGTAWRREGAHPEPRSPRCGGRANQDQ